jgi:hypothetical protein
VGGEAHTKAGLEARAAYRAVVHAVSHILKNLMTRGFFGPRFAPIVPE